MEWSAGESVRLSESTCRVLRSFLTPYEKIYRKAKAEVFEFDFVRSGALF
jgi:hypothetical protein